MARRVAAAVAEQVPSAAGEPGRFVVAGVPLTAGLASAFVEQTLAAVTAKASELAAVVGQERQEALAAVVGQERQKALRAVSSLRNSKNPQRTVRAAWTKAVVDFVDGVNRSAEGVRWGRCGRCCGTGCQRTRQTMASARVRRLRRRGGRVGLEAASGVEADVAVITAGGALISQQEGDEARRILGEYRLGQVGRNAAGMNITRWVGRRSPAGAGLAGPGELEGVFPSWVALSALPTSSGKADPGPLAVARQALGRTVVGALWRSVEADEAARRRGGVWLWVAGWGMLRGWRGGWRLRWPSRFLRPSVSRGGSWWRVFR